MKKCLLLTLGLYMGFALFAQVQQKPGSGNALSFNGLTNYMGVPDDDGVNDFTTRAEFTIECWVKINPVQVDLSLTTNIIIAKVTGNAVHYSIFYYNQSAGSDAGKIVVAQYNETQTSLINSQKIVGDNQWHHIAFARRALPLNTFVLYVDGIFQGSV